MGQDPDKCVGCGSTSGLIKKFSAPNIGKGSSSSLEHNSGVLGAGIIETPFGVFPVEVTREVRYDRADGSQIVQRDIRKAGGTETVGQIIGIEKDNSSA